MKWGIGGRKVPTEKLKGELVGAGIGIPEYSGGTWGPGFGSLKLVKTA